MATLTLDGNEYEIDSLSAEAQAQVTNLQVCDNHLANLAQNQAIFQTARNAYARALKSQLPEKAHPNKKKGVIAIDGTNYELEKFSQAAQAELASLQLVDRKLADLAGEAAFVQTARNAYASALRAAVN